jgi:predicted secreted protein
MTYRVCTPTAHTVIARFLDEAAKISKDVSSRYGG